MAQVPFGEPAKGRSSFGLPWFAFCIERFSFQGLAGSKRMADENRRVCFSARFHWLGNGGDRSCIADDPVVPSGSLE